MLAWTGCSTPREKKTDRFLPLSPESMSKLEHYYDVEITYASDAIEGNALNLAETTLVIDEAQNTELIGLLIGYEHDFHSDQACPNPLAS